MPDVDGVEREVGVGAEVGALGEGLAPLGEIWCRGSRRRRSRRSSPPWSVSTSTVRTSVVRNRARRRADAGLGHRGALVGRREPEGRGRRCRMHGRRPRGARASSPNGSKSSAETICSAWFVAPLRRLTGARAVTVIERTDGDEPGGTEHHEHEAGDQEDPGPAPAAGPGAVDRGPGEVRVGRRGPGGRRSSARAAWPRESMRAADGAAAATADASGDRAGRQRRRERRTPGRAGGVERGRELGGGPGSAGPGRARGSARPARRPRASTSGRLVRTAGAAAATRAIAAAISVSPPNGR